MVYEETFVERDQHRIYVRDHPGAEPTIVVMHGFPDNLHLYDRLLPHLSPPRRVVAFDFLGWGNSDKPPGYPYTTDNQVGDLDAVITLLKLGPVVLVAHDASGPPAIDWALAHPERVEGLVSRRAQGGAPAPAAARQRRHRPQRWSSTCGRTAAEPPHQTEDGRTGSGSLRRHHPRVPASSQRRGRRA